MLIKAHLPKHIRILNVTALPANATLKDIVAFLNQQQKIMNTETFGDKLDEDSIVIVVQVHNRVEYLNYLIQSLSKVEGKEHLLLIFSHDVYSTEINSLIDQITFCKVLQIFYPYSIQLYPTEFPGEHPNDCPRDLKRDQAIKKNCNNAGYPDMYGHYREAKMVQTKHHWFWKLNHVFDRLTVMKDFTGIVLLVEEDHYLTPDVISVLKLMNKLKQESCKDCSIMTIGTYDKHPAYVGISNQVDITHWQSTKHNMGMALTREVWIKIKGCSSQFCKFDDYNWDWSLHFIGRTCTALNVMIARSPHIFHIGECGVHHKGKNCDPVSRILQIDSLLRSNKQYLFPSSMSIRAYPRGGIKKPKPNGGWGDIRDQELCIKFTQDSR